MKNIFVILTIGLGLLSCEIEKLSPEDVADAPPIYGEPIPTVDPNSIIVPCSLTNEIIRFNNTNYGVASVTVNPPFAPLGAFNATYSISTDLIGTTEMEFFFKSSPTSGYYTTHGGGQMTSSNQVVVRTLQGGSYFYGDAGGNVYVQNYTDSIVISYCDVDFTGTFTIPGSKGKFTY
jgi:hypothetical protein